MEAHEHATASGTFNACAAHTCNLRASTNGRTLDATGTTAQALYTACMKMAINLTKVDMVCKYEGEYRVDAMLHRIRKRMLPGTGR